MEKTKQRAKKKTNSREDDVVKFLEWQLNRQKVRYERDRNFSLEDITSKNTMIESLEAKLSALLEEAENTSKERDGLKEQLEVNKKLLKSHVRAKLVSEEKSECKEKKLKKTITRLEQQLIVMQERHDKTVKDLTQQHEKSESSMQADFHKRLTLYQDERDKTFQEQTGKHQAEVEKMKKLIHEREEEIKKLNMKLQKTVEEHEMALEEQRELREKAQSKHFLNCMELKLKIKDQAETITALENREDLTNKLNAALEATQNKIEIIKKKNREIENVKKEKKEVQDKFSHEKDTNALLQATLEDLKDRTKFLENELNEEESANKELQTELTETKQKICHLNDEMERLQYKVGAYEPERDRMNIKARDMETYQLRFKEDLQDCMSIIDQPKDLRKRVLILKRHYVDRKKRDYLDEETRLAYQHRADCLGKKLECCKRIQKAHSGELRNCELRLQSNAADAHKNRTFLIKLLNEKIEKEHRPQRGLQPAGPHPVPEVAEDERSYVDAGLPSVDI